MAFTAASPANYEDVAFAVAFTAMEIVAAVIPEARMADERLSDIANRLFDLSAKSPDPSCKVLFGLIADKLMGTEESGL